MTLVPFICVYSRSFKHAITNFLSKRLQNALKFDGNETNFGIKNTPGHVHIEVYLILVGTGLLRHAIDINACSSKSSPINPSPYTVHLPEYG